VIGVAGGVAAGKSSVARALAGPDGVVVDADQLAREELDSQAGRARLSERYGSAALGPDGRPDRAFLAQRVFAHPEERSWLEGWIHPAVQVRMRAALQTARAERVKRVILDVPLLFESEELHDLVQACDALVFVDAPIELREARAQAARGWGEGEVARRELTQISPAEKRERADYVIENSGDLADLHAAVSDVLAALA